MPVFRGIALLLLDLAYILFGIGLLYLGGELLVRSVTDLALAFRVQPFVVAFTVVAFGTSAPELAASGAAAWLDAPDLALGNVIGSNIANIGLILGLTAVLSPMAMERSVLRREVPFMLATALALLAFVATGVLNRLQALLLLAVLVVFLIVLVRSQALPARAPGEPRPATPWRAVLGALAGIALLVLGAKLLVDGAQSLARAFGVSEAIIGLTMVAFGTSLPELASCLVAALRRHTGIVLGNIIGSNVFNTLFIMPVVMLIRPFPATLDDWLVHLLVMLAFSVLLPVFFAVGDRLSRVDGVMLVAGYLAYIAYIAYIA